MEFTEYIRLFRNWLWLILVGAFVGGGLIYIFNAGKPAIYSARVIVSIGQYIQDPNPTTSQIYIGQNLVATYQQIIQTTDVLQGVVDSLKLPFPAEALRGVVSTDSIPATSLLTITVTYIDPILAADIANAVATQLIIHSPTNLTADQQAQVDLANKQIMALTQHLQQQNDSLATVNEQIAATQDTQEIARLTDLKTSLTAQITQASTTIAQFQSTVNSIQQRANSLVIVERATIPESAQAKGSLTNILFGAAVGISIAAALILVIEYLDDKIRTSQIATDLLGLPVLGSIPSFEKKKASYPERLITKMDSMSPIAELYRRLQTNLTFTSTDGDSLRKIFVITSAGPEEGKSVTAANLAATMAYDGIHVLLIDADLRRPKQHEIFGLENENGLATLLMANSEIRARSEPDQDKQTLNKLNQCIQLTKIPALKVITSGFLPQNPSQVLRSSLMKRWIDAFRTAKDIDVIIIDTPPVLLFGDSVILAAVADAEAVMIVDSQHTRRRAAISTKEQFEQVGISMKGVVLNRVNAHDELGSYGYDYGDYYNSSADKNKIQRRRRWNLLPWRR